MDQILSLQTNCERHSRVKLIPQARDLFWEKASAEPPLRWERWSTQVQLAILDEECITLYFFLGQKPGSMHLSPTPNYEQPMDDPNEATERERKTKNEDKKSIENHLLIFRQKNLKIITFEEHFARRKNTPLSKTCNGSNLIKL